MRQSFPREDAIRARKRTPVHLRAEKIGALSDPARTVTLPGALATATHRLCIQPLNLIQTHDRTTQYRPINQCNMAVSGSIMTVP